METAYNLNLLRNVTNDDFNSLISQVELERDGYEYYFAIDSDLIGNYCYPFGIVPEETGNERMSKLNTEYLSDEQITLHTIFNLNLNHKKILLLDQYFYEVEGMLYKATKESKNKLEVLDMNFPKFKITSEENSLIELLYDSFSSMYAKVLLHINGLKKATNILKEGKLILDSNDINDENLKRITNHCKGSKSLTEIVIDNMKSVINKFDNRNVDLYSSRRRDAVVIDRIISFNIEAQKLSNTKKIFILLSDSKLIKNTFLRLKDNEHRAEYPKSLKKEIIYFRNVPQSFAYIICLAYSKNEKIDFGKTIENLINLRNASKQLSERFNITSDKLNLNSNELLSKNIFINYNHLRNAFENSGLLKSFEPLFQTIKTDLKSQNIEDVAQIFEKYRNEEKKFIKEVEDQHIYFLRTLIKVGNFNSSFVYGLDKIRHNGAIFDLSKGADYIEGNYQHLPLMLTFSGLPDEYSDNMKELIKLVISHLSYDSKRICDKLEILLNQMNSSKIYEYNKSEINLIKAFIFMILPSLKQSEVKENDIMAYEWLSELKIHDKNIELIANRQYLLIWASRRIKKYKESVNLAKKAIKQFENDPRFYHGLFLSQYCIFEDENSQKLSSIDEMLHNLNKSIFLYNSFIQRNYYRNNLSASLNSAMLDSYNNSYSYCLCLKAQQFDKLSSQFIDTVKESRQLFNKLKNIHGKFNDILPEYYDTESLIEYLESFYIDENKKIIKLEYAFEAINTAISLSNNESLIMKYNHKRKLIQQRILEIKNFWS